MFKHRDVPHCQHCGGALVLHNEEPGDRISAIDRQWKCLHCGTQRPVVYLLERSLKKPA
jgi:hypothetical protein